MTDGGDEYYKVLIDHGRYKDDKDTRDELGKVTHGIADEEERSSTGEVGLGYLLPSAMIVYGVGVPIFYSQSSIFYSSYSCVTLPNSYSHSYILLCIVTHTTYSCLP